MKDDLIERDILVTEAEGSTAGKRVLLDAFMIATVRERDENTCIQLNKKTGGDYFKVKEEFDEVYKLKKQATGLGMNENCM